MNSILAILCVFVLACSSMHPQKVGVHFEEPELDEFGVDPTLYFNPNMTSWLTIVGGTTVPNAEKYPYMGSLQNAQGRHFCGCSLLTASWVMTAAHCVSNGATYNVRFGSLRSASGGVTGRTKGAIRHPRYQSPSRFSNDVALIELAQPLSLGNTIQPVATAIPGDGSSAGGVSSTVTGWGATREGGSGSAVLLEVTVPLRTNTECKQSYGNSVDDTMICAGLPEGGKDACQGDSGGPLVAQSSSGTRKEVGVVSWGQGCARRGYYGVYGRVETFEEWIESLIGPRK